MPALEGVALTGRRRGLHGVFAVVNRLVPDRTAAGRVKAHRIRLGHPLRKEGEVLLHGLREVIGALKLGVRIPASDGLAGLPLLKLRHLKQVAIGDGLACDVHAIARKGDGALDALPGRL